LSPRASSPHIEDKGGAASLLGKRREGREGPPFSPCPGARRRLDID